MSTSMMSVSSRQIALGVALAAVVGLVVGGLLGRATAPSAGDSPEDLLCAAVEQTEDVQQLDEELGQDSIDMTSSELLDAIAPLARATGSDTDNAELEDAASGLATAASRIDMAGMREEFQVLRSHCGV